MAMPVVCKWNVVNIECDPIKQMQVCATLSIIYLPAFFCL